MKLKNVNIAFLLSLALFLLRPSPCLQAQTSVEFRNSGNHLRIEDHVDLHLTQFSVSCWVMPHEGGEPITTGASGISVYPIVSRGSHDAAGEFSINYLLGLREKDHVMFFEFESYDAQKLKYIAHSISGFTPLRDSTWYHMAITCSETEIKIYLNGVLESMLEIFDSPAADFPADLGIAASFNKYSLPIGSFRGRIDALLITGTAQTQEQLLAQMNSELMTSHEDLILGLGFNEGVGTWISPEGSLSGSMITAPEIIWSEGPFFNSLVPPLKDPEPLLQIGIISDPQYCDCDPPYWADRVYRETLNKLPIAIDSLNALGVDFSITLGDAIDTFYTSFDSLLPLYEALENPHYFVLGNHDFAVEDSLKSKVPTLLGMPDSYYELETGKWRFLILDGTELAGYTRILHPEYGAEADSLLESIEGEINHESWNGGISREQQKWIKEQIELAEIRQQQVILFCHFPILPDSGHLNLWNKDSILNLLQEHDHVVAYINGHNHYGGYVFEQGKHFLTNYGMVETEDSNSFSILNLMPNYLQVKGYGFNPDRILRFPNAFKTIPQPILSNSILHYSHDSADYIGTIHLPGYQQDEVNFALIGNPDAQDNGVFKIQNDSLFLNISPDYQVKQSYSIQVGGIDFLFDSTSANLNLQLDPRIAIQHFPLSDTLIHVGTSYTLPLDSLFTDFSRNGLVFSCEVSDTACIACHITDSNALFQALQFGESQIVLSATDTYTSSSLQDTFVISVTDPDNIPPARLKFGIQSIPYKDSLRIQLDTLFSDGNNDSLKFEISASVDPLLDYELKEDHQLIIWAKEAAWSKIRILANDMRGGTDSLDLELKFNTPPIKTGLLSTLHYKAGKAAEEMLLDTLYSDPDLDLLYYDIFSNGDGIETALTNNVLSLNPVNAGKAEVIIRVDDLYGGILWDTLHVSVSSGLSIEESDAPSNFLRIYPNPAGHVLYFESLHSEETNLKLRVLNQLGEVLVQTESYAGNGSSPITISLDPLQDGFYFLVVAGGENHYSVLKFIKLSAK